MADVNKIDGQSIASVGDYPGKIKPAIVRWVVPGWYAQQLFTIAAVAGRIYYTPIFVTETTTYIRIGINVAAGAVGTADLRIYNWSGGLPGSQVLSAGTVDTTNIAVLEIVINQQLTRGYYFLAVRCSAAPSLRGFDGTTAITPPVGGQYPDQTDAINRVNMTVDAAMADPAPAPAAAVAAGFCFVRLREN